MLRIVSARRSIRQTTTPAQTTNTSYRNKHEFFMLLLHTNKNPKGNTNNPPFCCRETILHKNQNKGFIYHCIWFSSRTGKEATKVFFHLTENIYSQSKAKSTPSLIPTYWVSVLPVPGSHGGRSLGALAKKEQGLIYIYISISLD